jgi:putative hydrolase of the HAD superfamily
MAPVVTFDAGQTLIDLDLDFLAARLAERGWHVSAEGLGRAAPAAWRHYDELVAGGGRHPWKAFMARLLAGVDIEDDAVVEWLWQEQPRRNLWRKTMPGMVEVARELRARGVRVAVLSNSEGRLAELLDEIGLGDAFDAVIDSGRVGIEKPDPRIFAAALEAVGGGEAPIHVGDSWAADVEGALAAGWRPIWYRSRSSMAPHQDPRVWVARDADEVRDVLRTAHATGA